MQHTVKANAKQQEWCALKQKGLIKTLENPWKALGKSLEKGINFLLVLLLNTKSSKQQGKKGKRVVWRPLLAQSKKISDRWRSKTLHLRLIGCGLKVEVAERSDVLEAFFQRFSLGFLEFLEFFLGFSILFLGFCFQRFSMVYGFCFLSLPLGSIPNLFYNCPKVFYGLSLIYLEVWWSAVSFRFCLHTVSLLFTIGFW